MWLSEMWTNCMGLIRRMSWQRLRKFICGVRKNNKNPATDLISKVPETDPNTAPIPEKMRIPIRMVSAGVSNFSRLKGHLADITKTENDYSFYKTPFQQNIQKFFKVFLIILLILLIIEIIIILWIWQMPTDRYNRFVACLDVGTVSSLKERIAYYMACLVGSLGG